jgi:hypothetical protein
MALWELEPVDLDTTGVHAAVLPGGDVLYFSYDPPEENNVDRCKWQIWNEDRGPLEPTARILNRNLFCAGHCWLGDGRLLVAAGQSWNWITQGIWGADHDVHTFDPRSRAWTRHANMPAGRYYPTCVTLADGNGFIIGGAWTRVPVNRVNHEAETFAWRTGTLSARIPFNPGFIEELYPFVQLIPNGSAQGLLWVHSGKRGRLYSPATATWLPATFETTGGGLRNYPKQGAAVMLPLLQEQGFRTRVLLVGGGTSTDAATNIAQIFDFNPAVPEQSGYREPNGGRQGFARFMSDAVLLADGTVLVCAGSAEGGADHSHGAVLDAEIFDPVAETFRTTARINHQRMYHASAVLLPSGRVALAGHTEHWNPDHVFEDKSIDVYTPDYLIGRVRPRLTSVAERLAYGELAEIVTPDAAKVVRVAFVRASTVTHSNNMDQRWVGLTIVSRAADRVRVRIPEERPVMPPGPYMVFVIDAAGTPSIARFTFIDPVRAAPNRVLVVDRWITVREADSGVDTGIDFEPGDDFEFDATGDIWAGVIFTGRNGPEGWSNVDYDPKFPLHEGAQAHPYSLIGMFRGRSFFYIGTHLGPTRYTDADRRRLVLRTNDDSPGNGNGEFRCRVRIWRAEQAAGRMVITGITANPPGDDVAAGGGEFVTLKNEGQRAVDLLGWSLTDTVGHRLFITRPRTVGGGAVLRIHTGPGTDDPDDYFCGRRSAVWNNPGDTVALVAPDGRVVSRLSY